MSPEARGFFRPGGCRKDRVGVNGEPRNLERELRAISACHQTLLRAVDEQTLLQDICRIVCDEAGYRLAWVGYAEEGEGKPVRPIAWAGFEDGYLAGVNITWGDTERGRGPTGTAIRTGKVVRADDSLSDPKMTPWSEAAASRGYRGSVALPLKDEHGRAFAALNIYSSQPRAFDADEIELLEQFAADLSFGISVLRDRAERAKADAERAAAQSALAASESKFRTIFLSSPDAIITTRLSDGVLLDVNDRFTSMTGWDRDEAIGRRAVGLPLWDDPRDRERFLGDLREKGVVDTIVVPIRRKDGTVLTVQTSAQIVQLEGVECITGIIRDITEQRRIEAQVYEGRERLRAIIEQAAAGIAQVGLDGVILDANDRLCEMLGFAHGGLLGRTFADFLYPGEANRSVENIEMLRRGEIDSYRIQKRYLTKGGTVLWADAAVTLARDSQGDPDYIVVVALDVSERKAAEDALANTARALRALSGVNEAVVRATSEDELLTRVCESVVASQGYALAFVGFALNDEQKTVVPVGKAGPGIGLLDELRVSWGEGPLGTGAVGRSIREREPVVVGSMHTDSSMAAWSDIVERWSLESVVSLPLAAPDGTVFGAIVIYSAEPDAFGADEVALLSNMAEDLSYGIEALRSRERRAQAERELISSHEKLQGLLHSVTETMGKIVEVRDPYTQGHQKSVAAIAVKIADEMGLSEYERDTIEIAALVHDLGKLAVPAEILTKPGRISEIEYAIIKVHPQTSYEILKDIDFGWPIADVVLQHHEYMDGSGYPNGLKGDEILMPARVLTVADAVEAMAAHRPYRPALGLEIAMEQLGEHAARYDPQVVAACVRLVESGKIAL